MTDGHSAVTDTVRVNQFLKARCRRGPRRECVVVKKGEGGSELHELHFELAVRSLRQPPPPIRMVSECGPSHIQLRSLWGINWALVLKKYTSVFIFFGWVCTGDGKKWLLRKAGVREEDRPRFHRLLSPWVLQQPGSYTPAKEPAPNPRGF